MKVIQKIRGPKPRPIPVRIIEKIIHTEKGCWEWQGARTIQGYGRMISKRVNHLAHRLSYESFCGPIPDGLCVLHKCDNPPCVNPEHLFVGTNKENVADKVRKGRGFRKVLKAVCNSGHPLYGENLYHAPDGGRLCKACRKQAIIRMKARKNERI